MWARRSPGASGVPDGRSRGPPAAGGRGEARPRPDPARPGPAAAVRSSGAGAAPRVQARARRSARGRWVGAVRGWVLGQRAAAGPRCGAGVAAPVGAAAGLSRDAGFAGAAGSGLSPRAGTAGAGWLLAPGPARWRNARLGGQVLARTLVDRGRQRSVVPCCAVGLGCLSPGAPVQPPAAARRSGRFGGAVRPGAGRTVVADEETPLCQSPCAVCAVPTARSPAAAELSSGSTAGCRIAVAASGRRGMWLLWALPALTFPAVSEA